MVIVGVVVEFFFFREVGGVYSLFLSFFKRTILVSSKYKINVCICFLYKEDCERKFSEEN